MLYDQMICKPFENVKRPLQLLIPTIQYNSIQYNAIQYTTFITRGCASFHWTVNKNKFVFGVSAIFFVF